jgi:hypothetical protein
MSNDDDHRDLYRELYLYVKGKASTAQVVGNPGTPAHTPWQVETKVADVLVVFEGPFAGKKLSDHSYRDWDPPSWVASGPRSLFAHLVYRSPDPATTRAICIESWRNRNAGWIYVTQDTLPNPWNTPPDAALISSPTLHRR